MGKQEDTIRHLEAENRKLFEELKRKKDKLYTAMNELKEKNAELQERSRDISDSVNYAKRIQLAIMPPRYEVNNILEDSFIMYLPKDVVSGDFYFVKKINNEVVFSVVDCTGHGVPGALMSVVGFNCLDQAVTKDKMTRPCDILSALDEGVNATLRQTADESGVRDGMDLALCAYNSTSKVLQYSGAYNPVYIVSASRNLMVAREREIDDMHPRILTSRKDNNNMSELEILGDASNEASDRGAWLGGHEDVEYDAVMSTKNNNLFEIKADKLPIGVNVDGVVDIYTNNTVQLSTGDAVYLFSDGYTDQFGGPENRKFKHHRLKELLLSIQDKSMIEQKRILVKTFSQWKGNEDQIDDVLVMGIRVA